MDASEARAYIERWQAVEEIERQEAQAATIQDRWRQLNALRRRAARLGIQRAGDDGEMEIFSLWANLKAKYVST